MSKSTSQPTRFTTECVVIARLLPRQNRDVLSHDEERALASALSYVTAQLPHLFSRRVAVEGGDPQDIAQEALARFVVAAGKGAVDPDKSPSGYLMSIAMNVVRDNLRRAPNPVPTADVFPANDTEIDQVTRLLDRLASADSVRNALARAHAEGDHMVLEVVSAWLNLAHSMGDAPSSRAVAEEVGVSKTTVANVLERFKQYLPAEA